MVAEMLQGIHFIASVEAVSLGVKAGLHPWIVYDIISNAAGNSWYVLNQYETANCTVKKSSHTYMLFWVTIALFYLFEKEQFQKAVRLKILKKEACFITIHKCSLLSINPNVWLFALTKC